MVGVEGKGVIGAAAGGEGGLFVFFVREEVRGRGWRRRERKEGKREDHTLPT